MDPEDDNTAVLDDEGSENDPALDTDADADPDAPEGADAGDPEGDDGEGSATDEVTITIGDEPAPAEEEDDTQAKPWVRELRKSHREQARALRERDAEIARLKGAQQPAAAVALGPKPKLEDCEYDTARFETELEAWHERKRVVDEESAKKQAAAENEKKSWQARLDNHAKLKGELKVKNYDDAAATVEATLSVTQRGLIVHGAENSAQLEYALGKNPATLKKLAAITDPVLFAFAVAKLETKLKVTPRKTAPVPERDVRGSAPAGGGGGSGDKVLERLRAEADKSGDRSKVTAYMRTQKQKQAQR
jgi:hypothetical protein